MHFLPQTNYLSCQNPPSQKDGTPHGHATSKMFWGNLPKIQRLHTEPNTCKKNILLLKDFALKSITELIS